MICKFEELYQQEAQGQRARYQALREGFKAQFGSDEGGEYFSAPGRSEIGGNHTDHQHGRVLAAAVNLDIAAYARKTDNGRAVLKSAEYTKMDDIDISDLDMKEEEKDHPFMQGMDKVYKQMMTALNEMGVKPIEAVGQEFNPDFHNAVMHVEDEELGENIVAEEFQKGYMYRDSVVRHSMVKVAN